MLSLLQSSRGAVPGPQAGASLAAPGSLSRSWRRSKLLGGARPARLAAQAAPAATSGAADGPTARPERARTSHLGPLNLGHALAGMAALSAALPGSSAAVESAPEGFLQLLLEFIESLGPLGPAVYTLLVALFECIPLFPTQPLSLASGLLFGAQQGAACMCIGTTLAAAAAFAISRGVGRPLAERLIRKEIDEIEADMSVDSTNNLESKLQFVHDAIEHGSWWKQAGAIFLLRLTPVVPFSASNYLLGLTPLPLAPYLVGTMAGMGCWSVVYASLGGASRSLLAKGVSADALLADLLERASEYTQEVATAGLILGLVVAGTWGADALRKALAAAPQQAAGGFAPPLLPPSKPGQRQLVEQMED